MRKFTLFIASLFLSLGVMAQAEGTILGVKNVPTTRVDLSQGLESGYYLLKQTNSNNGAAGGQGVGWIKAESEAANVKATSKNTGTPGIDGVTYVWYVEVVDAANNLITISTANKVAAWQTPYQGQKNLVAYESKATLKYHTGTVNLSGDATPNDGSCFISDQETTAFVHFSGDNLGSWNDTNSASMFMVELYELEEADLNKFSANDNTNAVAALDAAIANGVALSACIGNLVGQYQYTGEGSYEEKFNAIVAYREAITSTTTPTPAEVEAKTAELAAIIASFTPNLPVDGNIYTFKNVQKDGSVCWFKYDETTAAIQLTTTEEEATEFTCAKLENGKYTFTFNVGETMKYLTYRCHDEGSTGVADAYDESDSKTTDITIEKMTTGNNISVDVSATRYVTISAYRTSRSQHSYIVVKTGPVFDGANAPYYNDNFSSAFIMDEVESIPTAIENVETEAAEQVIYDLTGRKVKAENGNLKGIYIINGVKTLVK